MSKVSIIVPVFNADQYLNKCIDSLLSQTYKDIEVILIDDGSNDESAKICDEYAQKHENVIAKHVENGGQGRARNIGISIANGEYFMFCDSDDYFDEDMVEYLYNTIKDTPEIKIAMCGLKFLYKNKTIERIVYDQSFVTDIDKIVDMYFHENKIVSSPVNKIYHKSVFEDVKYPENMIYEDRFVSLPIFLNFPNIYVCDKAKYNYFIRGGSTIQSNFSIKNMDYLKVLEQEQSLLSGTKYEKLAIYSYCDGIEMLLRDIMAKGVKKSKDFYNILLDKLKMHIEQNKDVFDKKSLTKWQKYYKHKHFLPYWYYARHLVGKKLHKVN